MATADGSLPLHCAISTRDTVEVVQWVVEQWPDAVKMADSKRNLPLHVACKMRIVSLEVVQCLVEQWPGAVQLTTGDGRLPLLLACWGNWEACWGEYMALGENTASLEVVQYLAEQWPGAVKVVSSDTSICCIQQLNWDVYSYLCDMQNLIMTETENTWALMEALFRPINSDRPVREVELLPGLTTDDILGTGITWELF
jgi:hypothetical protein